MKDHCIGSWSVLLVDDEEDIRDVLSVSLEDMGYSVQLAENGHEALALFQRSTPPIVLTDIKMPGMDGIELLQRIKGLNPEVEVIMITGHGDMDLAVKSLKYEAGDFITKPINADALEIALKRVRDKIVMRRQLKDYTESLEALIKEKTELQDHLSSLGLMISSISHAIKGLLTGLDGGVYLIDSGVAKESDHLVREGLQAVKVTVERIRKLALDILYYAKERDLQRESVNVITFIDDVARAIEPKITEQGIEFVREFDRDLGAVEIDAGYVHSALMNILENAVDACIRDEGKDYHKIVLGLSADGDDIVFEVFDNGVGMSQDAVENIFEPFFSSKGRKGTGLGLFISNKIVRQHGGRIDVKSTPEYGTLFTVRIPKTQPVSVNPPDGTAQSSRTEQLG